MAAQLAVTCCSLYITAVLLCYVCATEKRKVQKEREGANITLKTAGSQPDAQLVWTFGAESPNIRIATVRSNEVNSDYEERFRDRLFLDSLTGSLTITQVKTSDSGIYQFQSIGTKILTRDFQLDVYSAVPAPSITVTSSVINSSSIMECSVHNSRELLLSWFRGEERLKHTSSPKLSSTLTLSLEVDAPDGGNYSCVAENPFEKKNTKLLKKDIQLGNAENSGWCHSEVTIRLLISAGIGLVMIVLLVDHIRL